MLASHFANIRLLHMSCVVLSGSLFAFRGFLRVGDIALANHRVLRVASYIIDTTLLISAVLLTMILHQYPIQDAWLTTKVLLLILYIGLGTLALKRTRTTAGRSAALIGALLVFGFIVGVAITHHPAGWFLFLGR